MGDEEMEILRDLGAGRMRSRNETEERRIMKRKRIIMKLMTINWLCPQAVQREAAVIEFI